MASALTEIGSRFEVKENPAKKDSASGVALPAGTCAAAGAGAPAERVPLAPTKAKTRNAVLVALQRSVALSLFECLRLHLHGYVV